MFNFAIDLSYQKNNGHNEIIRYKDIDVIPNGGLSIFNALKKYVINEINKKFHKHLNWLEMIILKDDMKIFSIKIKSLVELEKIYGFITSSSCGGDVIFSSLGFINKNNNYRVEYFENNVIISSL